MPNNVAPFKVDPDSVRHGLPRALPHFATSPDERAARRAAAPEYVGQRPGSAYAHAHANANANANAKVILVAAERAHAARPTAVPPADLNRQLERIGLHRQQAVVGLVGDVAFELFELG